MVSGLEPKKPDKATLSHKLRKNRDIMYPQIYMRRCLDKKVDFCHLFIDSILRSYKLFRIGTN